MSRAQTYAEVATASERWLAAEERGERGAAASWMASVWHRKALDASGSRLCIDDRQRRASRLPLAGGDWRTTAIQIPRDDFALVRVDRDEPWAIRLFTWFKASGGAWRVASEAVCERAWRRERYSPQSAEREILATLDTYYQAVEAGDAEPLQTIFDDGWHMKNHEGGEVVAEDKPTFLVRVAGQPFPGYCDDRQITDVQVLGDRLGQVRVDKPSARVVTVFTFFRLERGWTIADKAWSEEKP